MSEEQTPISEAEQNWRDDVSESGIATLKIVDGETKKFVFLSEGEKRTHQDYGTSIVFEVEHEGEKMNWYVRENNYSLLGQIKAIGKLTGVLVEVSREGSKKSDTRYTLKPL